MNIFEQLNRINDEESLSEKYNVKNSRELRELRKSSTRCNYKLESHDKQLNSINEEYFTTYSYDEWIQGLEAAHSIYSEFGEDIYKKPLWSKIMELSACENLYKDLVAYMDAWIAHDGSKNFPHKSYAKHLEEAAFSGGVASDNSASGGTIRGRGASTQPGKDNYLNRMKSKNPDLVDTMVIKVSDIKPGMITQAGQVKEAEARNHVSGSNKMYIMHTNGYDGFWDLDETMDVMVDPDNNSKPFIGDYRDLLQKGLKENYKSNKRSV